MADLVRPPAGTKVQFGPFIVDLAVGELRKHGIFVRLQERPLRLLLALVERPGELITRDELRQRLWPDGTIVDFDHNISSCANKLRAALNDTARAPRYIETVGSRGYRFIAECRPVNEAEAPSSTPPPVDAPPTSPANLRYWWLALRLALIAICGLFLWSRLHRPAPAPPPRPVLAVLPFANLTGDPGQEYFSDGLTEEMISRLGQLDPQNMGVIARTSVMRYKNTGEPLDQIGRELGVDYLLEGSVRRSLGRVRVTAQLLKITDKGQLWSKEFTSEERDILNLQDDITRDIAGEIHQVLGLSLAANPTRSTALPDFEGYELYLKGRYSVSKRTVQGFQQSVDFFQRALQKNPNDARSFAALAGSYALMSGYYQGAPSELMPKAKAAALKAIELDPKLAEGHASLALVAQNYDWDWATAEREYRRAIALDPNDATAHHWYAEFLVSRGRFDEAFPEIERARRLDPVSLIVASDYAVFLHLSRQYDRAIQQFRSVLDMEPGFPRAQIVINTYIEKGMLKQALDQVETWKTLNKPSPGWPLMTNALINSRAGEMSKVRENVTQLEKLDDSPRVKTVTLAVSYIALGDHEKAMDLLEEAYRQHSPVIIFIGVDPTYDPLRTNPRFQSLLKKLNIPNHH